MRLKYILFSLSFLLGFKLIAQKFEPSFYISPTMYRNVGFENNFFGDLEVGGALLTSHWLSPELSVGYSFGRPNNQSYFNEEDPNLVDEELRSMFRSLFASAGVKARLTKRDEVWLVVVPKFTVGHFKFEGEYYVQNSPTRLVLEDYVENTETLAYFDVGLGIEGYLDSDFKWLGSLTLQYTTRDLEGAFRSLAFIQTDRSAPSASTQSLGISVRLQYCLF